ncbi:unnamed protein product [Musa acuminata subsp. malaccensis]|uniref:(wild Malaysian banana) hypothetical protein n=1 Tax=Musa acuminata subsp. malaccensis TaxID=214687 RepID=A0A804KV74_MUSAM|nr:PREDICTED: uncharacterized protein LOC104000701 [Musa acuminata subsp. malaccensis]CAG1853254.1 unnamed protein product [Musa acuminata subsp. malaccensis]
MDAIGGWVGGGAPPTRALEILRETVRILRADPSPFMTALALICPVSAALLSGALVPLATAALLSRRLDLLAVASGLPPARPLFQLCRHFVAILLSAAACFPLLVTALLLARSSIAYSVACSYAARKVRRVEFFAAVRPIWRCILFTYLWICAAISACVVLFLALLLLVCNLCAILGYPPEIIVYPALLVVLVFSIVYAHTIIVCNLAGVVSVLEEISGLRAFLRSVRLIRGKRQVGLLMFLGSTIGMGFVQGLFEHRVKTVSYGDGSSRLWEGPLLVFMYSFVVLVDSMMSAVFYFTCRSSIIEETDEDVHELEEKENVSTEVTDIK